MTAKFYDVHIFYSRKDGFSVPVRIETNEDLLTDEEVIEYSVEKSHIDTEDANNVDSVEEISEKEYNDMKGI